MEPRANPLFYAHDTRFEAHRASGPHPERPERLRAIQAGLLQPLVRAGATALHPREAQADELLRVHAPEHLAQLERALLQGSGYLDGDTFFSEGTREAAWLAAGAAADLGRTLVEHPRACAVLLSRPPGHHATRTRAMGFCLLNNVAVAAQAALAHGLPRVAIVDWDVHHGNGTQAIFEHDPRVLMISLHQFPLYPGTGRSEEVGVAEGRGYTANVPLPPGCGSREYAAAMQQVVAPLLAQFAPELVLVSAGYDAHADDPLGGMQLRDADYGALATYLLAISRGTGCERLGLVLEGGYDLGALERSGETTAKALLGARYDFEEGAPARAAQQAIDATRRALNAYWEL